MRYFTGVTDPVLKAEFLRTPGKNWKELREVALDYEMGKRYNKSMGAHVAATSSSKKGGGKKASHQEPAKKWACYRCGKVCKEKEEQSAHPAVCKAKDKVCKHCNKVGHYSSVCNALSKGPSSKGGPKAPAAAQAAAVYAAVPPAPAPAAPVGLAISAPVVTNATRT